MEYKDYPYYALGLVCYAVAKADGTIQQEEKEKLQSIVNRELENKVQKYSVN